MRPPCLLLTKTAYRNGRKTEDTVETQIEYLVTQAKSELPYTTFAFEDLTNHYYHLVRQISCHIVGNWDDADTVAQDVMIRVFQYLPDLKEPGSFEGWLRQIATNTAKSHVAREARERIKAERLHREPQTESEAATIPADGAESLDSIIANLNLEERSILSLRFMEDLGFAEISAHTGLKLSATKMRYYRALEKLRKQLGATRAE